MENIFEVGNGFYGFYGFYGEGGGFAAFFEGAMPEGLRIAGLLFSMSSSLCFTASDKAPSAALRMTIRKKLQRDRFAERWHALLPSPFPEGGMLLS